MVIWFARALNRLLEACIDVEHDRVADLGGGGAEGPHNVSAGVDREGLASRDTLQIRLVLGLIPETPIWLPWV